MKATMILNFIILVSMQSFSQTRAEQTKQGQLGRKILIDNGIKTECFSATQTQQGLVIGSRTESNIPVNYLYTIDKHFRKISELDRYIVLDYSPVTGDLLLGKYEVDPHQESMCREVDTYNFKTNKITFQCNVGWLYGDTNYSPNYDSVVLLTMQKATDGIGSDWVTKKVKLR